MSKTVLIQRTIPKIDIKRNIQPEYLELCACSSATVPVRKEYPEDGFSDEDIDESTY